MKPLYEIEALEPKIVTSIVWSCFARQSRKQSMQQLLMGGVDPAHGMQRKQVFEIPPIRREVESGEWSFEEMVRHRNHDLKEMIDEIEAQNKIEIIVSSVRFIDELMQLVRVNGSMVPLRAIVGMSKIYMIGRHIGPLELQQMKDRGLNVPPDIKTAVEVDKESGIIFPLDFEHEVMPDEGSAAWKAGVEVSNLGEFEQAGVVG